MSSLPARAALPQAPPGHKLIVEGSAAIPFSEGNEVFYNNVQEFNRDLSIAVIRHFSEVRQRERAEKKLRKERKAAGAQDLTEADVKALDETDWAARAADTAAADGLRVLDALAATALRSIRYLKEIPGVKHVTVNDLDEKAVEAAQRNVEFNGVDAARVTVRRGDATMVMYESRPPTPPSQQYDVIDIDPYGTCSPFLDAAVQSVTDGGLLCVTSTDMAVLSGNHPEVSWAKYGSVPTHGCHLHEMALRVVLQALQSAAAKYKRYIEPLLSCSADFYVRVFVRVRVSPNEVKRSCLKASYVLQSSQCPSFRLVPVGRLGGRNNTSWQAGLLPADAGVCPQTGGAVKIGGPIWNGPIHDQNFLRGLLERLRGGGGSAGNGSSGGGDAAQAADGGDGSGSGGGKSSSGRAAWEGQAGTHKRMLGTVTGMLEELPDAPLHYTVPALCETLRVSQPKLMELFAALINAGYRVSQTHREPTAVKTNAPDDVVWDIMRCWVKKHPVSDKRKAEPDSAGQIILRKEPVLEASFVVPSWLRAQKTAPKPEPRFPSNPEPFWGPKSRAGGKKRGRAELEGGGGGSGGGGGRSGGRGGNGRRQQQSQGGGADGAGAASNGGGTGEVSVVASGQEVSAVEPMAVDSGGGVAGAAASVDAKPAEGGAGDENRNSEASTASAAAGDGPAAAVPGAGT